MIECRNDTGTVNEPGDPCRVDDHYLTIRHGDGSMAWTRHIDPITIDQLAAPEVPGPDEVAAYREAGRASIAHANAATGVYVVTPPRAARVSAPTAVLWTRAQLDRPWHRVEHDDGDGPHTVSMWRSV